MPDFSKQSIENFLNTLGSSAPTPGGGAAAALTAATGVALVEMTSRINEAKLSKKTGKTDASAVRRVARLEKIHARLLRLMELDAAAFEAISKRLKEPPASAAFQSALKSGAKVPFEICELAVEALDVAREEVPRTGRWLVSDLAEAGVLLEAAFRSGRLNVEVNLKSMTDISFAKKTRAALDAAGQRALKAQRELMKIA